MLRSAISLFSAAALACAPLLHAQQRIDFRRDVEPILRDRCVSCHGSERQRKSLRLDLGNAARRGGRSGAAFVPGDAEQSLLFQHVTATRGKKRMPAEGPPLDSAQIEILRRWLDEGADWPTNGEPTDARHWAYVAPVRPAVPTVDARFRDRVRNPIDAFVLSRLERAGVEPSPAADRRTLARRAALDLTGLPASPEAVESFVADPSPNAWERYVDTLLESPAYGERWAAWWLDLARYADTKGYEKDARRTIWRYRDWVIDAFDADLPFDEFTVRQLAGDLLPDATIDDRLATAFHRNTMTNDEGGTDDEEFRVAAVIDRVNTTFDVWMASTISCAQCHEHKYDPIDQREYYGVYAFFNNTADADRPNESPTIPTPTREQRRRAAELDAVVAAVDAAVREPTPERIALRTDWERTARSAHERYAAMRPQTGPWRLARYTEPNFDTAWATAHAPLAPDGELVDVPWRERPDFAADGRVHALRGGNTAFYLARTITSDAAGTVELRLGSDDAIAVWLNGEKQLEKRVMRGAAPDQERVTVTLRGGDNELLLKIVNGGGPGGFAFRLAPPTIDDALLTALRKPAAERTTAERDRLAATWLDQDPALADLAERRRNALAAKEALGVVRTPVLEELPPNRRRTTREFVRGSFLSPGDVVEPHVPASLHAWPDGEPKNRLGFARWLVADDNPLLARVLVNRLWEQLFGAGLVPTTEDFGTQSDPPSHPRLLDWLATEARRGDWSLKHVLRTIVTSATYRQRATVRDDLRRRDPNNRLLARGPRFRLPAETIRDQALHVAGLLSDKRGGPSVMPDQPDAVWQVVYSGDRWLTSAGEDRWRRGLYTFWRRTSPYPSMVTFDAPSREFCVVRRIRTNTPLQALVTLNDPVFVAAARALARRVLDEAPDPSFSSRLDRMFLLAVGRRPTSDEHERLAVYLAGEVDAFVAAPERAAACVDAAAAAPGSSLAELAAWTTLAHVVMNLDEVLTKG